MERCRARRARCGFLVGASAVAGLTASRLVATVAAVWTSVVTVALTIYGLVARAAEWGVVAMVIAFVGTLVAGERT